MIGKNSRKELAFVIIVLFVCINITSAVATLNQKKQNSLDVTGTSAHNVPEDVVVTCYTFGYPGKTERQTIMSRAEVEAFYNKLKDIQNNLACNPSSEQSLQAQQEIISLAHHYNLVSEGFSLKKIPSPFLSTIPSQQKTPLPLLFGSKATERICTFATTGSGVALPIIILPRFIPILLTPIPRVFVGWNAREGTTSCGGLISGTGFIAYGPQKGLALGFWGIGITFSLPPFMNMYGLIGYALFATVKADHIDRYPPNNPPVVSGTDPGDGEINVPLSISELRFRIEDADADLMSYTVTTTPDIGSGQGNLKTDGVYSIPISGLQSKTLYTWHIDVTDGEDTSVYDFSFTTEPVEPIISNLIPADGEKNVFTDIGQLQFTIRDFQGDPMDYTVETSPDIGSGSANNVHNGTYIVPVNGLTVGTTYRWFVNVTDGNHWTRKTLTFKTGYPSQFNPFDYGWHYRKQITINHTKVAEDLTNFPVLVSIVDVDLSQKAQDDGNDLLFMNAAGTATRLNYEIEQFDASSGKLVAWVNVTTLSSNNDTTFYIYYGNPTCINQQNPTKVRDSNYRMIYHFEESSGNIIDSTGNRFDGVVGGAVTYGEEGKIGKAMLFIDANALINGITTSGNTFTISTWVKHGSDSNWKSIIDSRNGRAVFALYQGKVQYYDTEWRDSGLSYSTIDWNYVVISKSGTSITFFVNGNQATNTGINCNIGGTTRIGSSYDFDSTSRFQGTIDELAVSTVARTSAWINASYQNQNDPAQFINIGPEEPGL